MDNLMTNLEEDECIAVSDWKMKFLMSLFREVRFFGFFSPVLWAQAAVPPPSSRKEFYSQKKNAAPHARHVARHAAARRG